MFETKVFIPKSKIKTLVINEGRNKKLLEDKLGVELEVNIDGEITMRGEDSYKLLICENILKAIGRGFSHDKAFKLLNDNYILEVVDISDYAKTQKARVRLKGRIIGENGRAKRHLEDMTGCYITVYGKTVSLICEVNLSPIARDAVRMILEGAKHATAYRFIEKELRKLPEF